MAGVNSMLFAGLRMCASCRLLATRTYKVAADTSLQRITVPHRMMRRLEKAKVKQSQQVLQGRRQPKGPVIISCKRSQYNHHRGQTYTDFSPQHLASGGWKHAKSKGDYFTIQAFKSNPAMTHTQSETEVDTFGALSLNSNLVKGLEEMGISSPTNIQALTIPAMLEGKNVLCCAETGSGKTLSYLLPILERIQWYKKLMGGVPADNQPFAIILTPSRELAEQIQLVCEALGEHVPFTSSVMCGGRRTKRLIREHPQRSVDVLISTPGVLSKLLTNRLYSLSWLQHIVLDEADTLLDDSFSELTIRIISKLKVSGDNPVDSGSNTPSGTQVALVGATLPRSLETTLGQIVPLDSIAKVTTTHLHRLMPHIPHKFRRISHENKAECLVSHLKTSGARQVPTLVFCNKSSTSCYVGYLLEDNGISNVVLNGNMPQLVREGRFEQFQSGECDVLVCTDIASRGLDTIRAQHVINYDFPDFMSDYIHRSGRVGRVGSKVTGFVLSLVTHKWEVDLLWKIEAAARRMTELHNVNANIKRKLVGWAERRHLAKDMEGQA